MMNKDKIIKRYIPLSFGIFFLSFLFGYYIGYFNPQEAKSAYLEIFENFSFLFQLNNFLLFLFIFLNNSLKVFLFMFLGILGGVIPVFFLIVNGMTLGLVVWVVSQEVTLGEILLSLLPHGVFELPALFIGSALGISLGASSYKLISQRKKIKEIIKGPLKSDLIFSLRTFTYVILPLLFIAALIEVLLIHFIS